MKAWAGGSSGGRPPLCARISPCQRLATSGIPFPLVRRAALNIENRKVLVLGGYGLVGTAVCRELLARRPREIQIHSLRSEESRQAGEGPHAPACSPLLPPSAPNT